MILSKKYEQITFTFLMALGMSCIISFFMMLFMSGFNSMLIGKWLNSWALAFTFAFPAAYVLPRGIRKIMKTITFVDNN